MLQPIPLVKRKTVVSQVLRKYSADCLLTINAVAVMYLCKKIVITFHVSKNQALFYLAAFLGTDL